MFCMMLGVGGVEERIVDDRDDDDDDNRPSPPASPRAALVDDVPLIVTIVCSDSVFASFRRVIMAVRRLFHSTIKKHMVAMVDITAKITSWW